MVLGKPKTLPCIIGREVAGVRAQGRPSSRYGGFLKLGVPSWGFPMIRTIVFRGLYWGPPILGNDHIQPRDFFSGFRVWVSTLSKTQSLETRVQTHSCRRLSMTVAPRTEPEALSHVQSS